MKWYIFILALIMLTACRTTKDVYDSTTQHKVDSTSVRHICDNDSTFSREVSEKQIQSKKESIYIRDSIRIKDSIVLVVDHTGSVISRKRFREQDRHQDKLKESRTDKEKYLESKYKEVLKQQKQLIYENKSLHNLVKDHKTKIVEQTKLKQRYKVACLFFIMIMLFFVKKSYKRGCS